MKKKFLGLGAIALTALAGLGVAPATVSAATTLKAAHYLPPKHPVGMGYEFFATEVKRLSKGEVAIRIFPGSSLLGAKAISDGLRDQVADLGQVVMTYTPAYFPHGMLINDLAMVGENDIAGAMTVTELLLRECAACQAEFAKQGQVPLTGISTPGYVIIAKGDLNAPDKIKGAKLRAGGSLWDRFSRSMGAVGVNMPTEGMYEAVSRGTLNGVLYAVGGLKSHGLGDVATQVIMLSSGSFRSAAMISFSKASWGKLNAEQRGQILRAASNALVHATLAYLKTEEEGVKVAQQKKIPIVQPHPELLRLRNEFVENDLKNTVANAKTKPGLEDAAEFVANYRKLYAKYEKLVAAAGKDEAKLAEILYNEVYAKLDPATYGVK